MGDADVGARVRAARLAARLSQRQLGARLGLTQSRMSELENGGRRLSFSEAVEVALFLCVPVATLVSDGVRALLDEVGVEHLDDRAGEAPADLHAADGA